MPQATRDETEGSETEGRLGQARELMIEALAALDDVPFPNGCGAYLDQAIHDLTRVIGNGKAGTSVVAMGAAHRRVLLEPTPWDID